MALGCKPTNEMNNTKIVLYVEDKPEIRTGDELMISPDVGRAYRVTVSGIKKDPERVTCHYAGHRGHKVFYKTELEEWYVTGDLLINPER